jgi:hypothetical protein
MMEVAIDIASETAASFTAEKLHVFKVGMALVLNVLGDQIEIEVHSAGRRRLVAEVNANGVRLQVMVVTRRHTCDSETQM